MAKRHFEYYGPDREPLCGKCVDLLFGDVHAVGGVLADGRLVSWQYAPEYVHQCSNCGADTVLDIGFGRVFSSLERHEAEEAGKSVAVGHVPPRTGAVLP